MTTNGGNVQSAPSLTPQSAAGLKPRGRRSDENPYAEINENVVNAQEQQVVESGRPPPRPVDEEIISVRKVKIEESAAPMLNGLEESNPPGGVKGQGSPVRTPNGYASHGTQYSPQVTPNVNHRTVEPKAQSMPNSPTRFAPQVNGGHQSPPPNVYQPQPVRAKKEQIRYITRTTPPGTPIGHNSFEDHLQHSDEEPKQPMQPFRRASSPDDSMSWLQKQQQKLREKKARESRGRPVGDFVRSAQWREPSRDANLNYAPQPVRDFDQQPRREFQTYSQKETTYTYSSREPHTYAAKEPQTYAAREPQTYTAREPQRYAAREPQTYAAKEPQTYTPREPQPNGNLSWLEMQQQKLRERQEYGVQKPLHVDTSYHATTPSQMSPLRSDSGLSSPSTSASGSYRYGRPASPIHQIEDLEKSISELESLQSPPNRAAAPTPPNTYVNYQTTTETRSWQSHQRPLNRQASDTSHDREYIPSYKRQPEEYQVPSYQAPSHQAPSYGGSSAVTGLPPASPRKDRPASPG